MSPRISLFPVHSLACIARTECILVRKRLVMRSLLSKYSILLLLGLVGFIVSSCDIPSVSSASTADPPLRVTPIDTSADEMVATIQIIEDQDATDKLSVVNLKIGIDAIEEDN